jgi:voltage-gated potassium channel
MLVTTRRRISAKFAPLMFVFAAIYLAGLATMVVMLVDVPSLRETGLAIETDSLKPSAAEPDSMGSWFRIAIGIMMLLIWPCFWVEAVFHWVTRPWSAAYRRYHLRSLFFCFLPPLRMCARNPDMGGAMWLPWLGWRVADDQLRDQLKRYFGIPMLGIAVLILPVLAVEFFLKEQVADHFALRVGLHFSTGLIWFAFTTEFIVMISAAENRLDYCKKHWLDLAIILLPLISFLRSLQVIRATRLAKLTKVQQLSKMARVYRMRGVSTKAFRALLLIDAVTRLMQPKPEKLLVRLRLEHRRLNRELQEIENRIERVESELSSQRAQNQVPNSAS